ncbi:tRNA (adenine(58)-N(1))-methyltransferase non-catalytic subunit TRM6 [Dillenia turbinata]|uniref:tRNA (adenine(58)-N(1))-methyltransferase non-catalytic subunit TRM6 n=1 Tax=Dillenia turbinata TaxID=194707 RepID=A0AAN8ZM73_9MAGN
MSQNPRVTWEGCSVLLDINDGDRLVFARLSAGATLKIGNKNCSLRPLIGCPFGSLFQVETGDKDPSVPPSSLLRRLYFIYVDLQGKGEGQLVEDSRDNRTIVDNNKAQSLSAADIDEMRRQGAKGDDIVEALIANSATFEKKTAFSQEKHRLRKQKKYAPRVLLRRPFARRCICEAYFKKYPARIGFLRIDTLFLLLSMANVTAHSDILVVDMVGGLVTGALAERLGGSGYVCNTYLGATPSNIDIVTIFNLSEEICKRILHCPITDLSSAPTGTSEKTAAREDVHDMESELKEQTSTDNPASGEEAMVPSTIGTLESVPLTTNSPGSRISKSTKAGEWASEENISSWKTNGFSSYVQCLSYLNRWCSLIIAAPELDVCNAVQQLLPLLSYSAPFVIYHQCLQPLATCMHKLQLEKLAIGLQITEPWLREYQVLPSRTHPCMQMSAFGGYILSGIKICSNSLQSNT